MAVMGFGIIWGPLGMWIFRTEAQAEMLFTMVEVTLAPWLFTDAAKADLVVLKIGLQAPSVLLVFFGPRRRVLEHRVHL